MCSEGWVRYPCLSVMSWKSGQRELWKDNTINGTICHRGPDPERDAKEPLASVT
jgi:hypothetical protein